eukprot:GHVH01012500.1.p1 GENE.GHVH01012500.1~~GHVH01012500.1.p1  ORF type:complete len:118 (+),score=6.14 GHVH01012500.1:97-450(+)
MRTACTSIEVPPIHNISGSKNVATPRPTPLTATVLSVFLKPNALTSSSLNTETEAPVSTKPRTSFSPLLMVVFNPSDARPSVKWISTSSVVAACLKACSARCHRPSLSSPLSTASTS